MDDSNGSHEAPGLQPAWAPLPSSHPVTTHLSRAARGWGRCASRVRALWAPHFFDPQKCRKPPRFPGAALARSITSTVLPPLSTHLRITLGCEDRTTIRIDAPLDAQIRFGSREPLRQCVEHG